MNGNTSTKLKDKDRFVEPCNTCGWQKTKVWLIGCTDQLKFLHGQRLVTNLLFLLTSIHIIRVGVATLFSSADVQNSSLFTWESDEVDVILTQRRTSRRRPVVFCSLIYKLWFLISFPLKIPSLLSRPHFALHTFIFIFLYIHKIFLWPADDKC